MSPSENILSLRESLRLADIRLSEKLRELEEELRGWQLGIEIPLGEDYVFKKCNQKWRFLYNDGRPVSDMNRADRATFLTAWGSTQALEQAAETALRAALKTRECILDGGVRSTDD
jgi:hypothetical protein